ncbi:MAG: hypothetical protein A2086_03520 [Spirochaetes bacterium GWD1_27_9]|nr:MAG: hypothetical protein A2Z98_09820 [Spirochaetes bacterium GWB1_27_13]OHD25345.1 MAG: hypothetical protein A2Y34_00040 [Spirochaetes bacterium GWC1_27_15]OHD31125.1 MAG: hypothetical protein A2086_03520 [Spirochaetes bacterium GWD1_27_9]
MTLENHIKLFDKISFFYSLFFKYQVNQYDKILDKAKDFLKNDSPKTVLDIGCGTGALAYSLYKKNFIVTGIDASTKMIDNAKKLTHSNISFLKMDISKGLNFANDSFDLVISSYVAHGLPKNIRMQYYKEAYRCAKEKVIILDYNSKRDIFTDIVEYFEQGDYFNFIKNAKDEMQQITNNLSLYNVDKKAALYIMEKTQ